MLSAFMMHDRMLAMPDNFKILDSVVCTIPVLVVNVLILSKRSAKVLLHDPAVLLHPQLFSVYPHCPLDVSSLTD